MYQENLMRIIYVPLRQQFADLLTKFLHGVTHKKLLKLVSSFSSSGEMLDDKSFVELDKTVYVLIS